MKLTIEIHPEHQNGIAIYIHNGETRLLEVLAEKSATADQVTALVSATIAPAIRNALNAEPTFFLFAGEIGRAVYKSYSPEGETEMAEKVVTHAPEIGPIIQITKLTNAAALRMGIFHPIVDGIDGRVA